ncbi:enoyl-CoA hydratase-related protein [Sagittula stellata]|uniref:Enoyl-CoA hydratase n=1 Tax=Sagittula stellata (strain ATCC 700073 / DSM 11524 / E-37) TaxID=388399 RepID=A3K7Y3_SAGS3|nr:enoyl-CoA hydratase-related protein [Sagittula stellata]EBA06755.1 enoyl-CoA hydratase [Sagittula stellata E-37]
MTLVLNEEMAPGVGLLTLNRPDVRNALSFELRQQLIDALADFARNETIRCVVLTGGPDVFAAGADLKQLSRMGPIDMLEASPERYWQAISAFPKPLIAAVNGLALGGGFELVMHADIIVAGQSATFGLPEVKLGLLPGAGGTQRLPRAIGKSPAMRFLLTGDPIPAPLAAELGLLSDVVPDDQVLEAAREIASKIARRPPLAVRMIKQCVLNGADLPLDAGLEIERKSLQLLLASEDKAEGIAAFIEKRQAVFKGR